MRKPAGAFPTISTSVEMGSFCAAGTSCKAAADPPLFRRNEIGSCMLIIDKGRIKLNFPGHPLNKVLSEHEVLGELALFIAHHARMADAIADCALWSVDQPGFDILLQSQPSRMLHSFSCLAAGERQLIFTQQGPDCGRWSPCTTHTAN